MVPCTQDYVTDFAGELQAAAKQLLKCGAQVVLVLECVVAVEVFQATRQVIQDVQLA